MSVGGERRAFEAREAEQTHSLVDMISTYAIESTIWWDVGQGDRLGRAGSHGRVRGKADRSEREMEALIIRRWRHGDENGAPGARREKRGFPGLPTNR
jgi:hypothetical protein